MTLFYSDRDIRIRLRVSCENQEKLKAYIDSSFVPLFALKRDRFLGIEFTDKAFICTYEGKKQTFSYKDVKRIETVKDGLILYLKSNQYVSVATEASEKHNAELYDAVAFLRRHHRKIFSERAEIVYPEDADGRYQSDKEPASKITFALSEKEISRLLWYDYLIEEKMLVLLLPLFVGAVAALLLQNVWLAVFAGGLLILNTILTVMFFEHKDAYVRNHRGHLSALLYDDLLVIRLRDTDLELEYTAMRRLKNAFGLWRTRSGDFFVLTLPQRIEKENMPFFEALYQKISQASVLTARQSTLRRKKR